MEGKSFDKCLEDSSEANAENTVEKNFPFMEPDTSCLNNSPDEKRKVSNDEIESEISHDETKSEISNEQNRKELNNEKHGEFEEAAEGTNDKSEIECQESVPETIEMRNVEEQSSEKTYEDLIEENLHTLLEENLSLIEANTFITIEDTEETCEIDFFENEEDKLDEAAGGFTDVISEASKETDTKVSSLQQEVSEAKEKRSQGHQVKWGKTESFVIPEHIFPIVKLEMQHSDTDDKEIIKRPSAGILKNKNSKMDETPDDELPAYSELNFDDNERGYGGARPRPSRLSLFLRDLERRSFDEAFEDSSEGNIQRLVQRNFSFMEPDNFFTDEDLNEITKIESSDDEESKFDEAVGGALIGDLTLSPPINASVERLPKRQVRWEDTPPPLIPNHVKTGTKSKPSKISDTDKKNDNDKKKKKKKSKKSRFSCFLQCFNPKLPDDDDNDPDPRSLNSVPRASISGHIEDNMFNLKFNPVSFINGYKIKVINNVLPKECYFFKTQGIFFAFSNSVYLKMEISLKNKISLRPAGQFSLFITNPNNKAVHEIEIDYNVVEMPNKSMLISRHTKFHSESKKKLAVLDLRYYKSRRCSTYLYSKLRLVLDRCGDRDCPFLIRMDNQHLKYDIFTL